MSDPICADLHHNGAERDAALRLALKRIDRGKHVR
jgi:hypothetical protein